MKSMDLERLPAIEIEAFKEAAAHFASGVTVITTVLGGKLYGTTVSAVSALSENPPMMLTCLKSTSSTHDAVLSAGVFAINILAEGQGGVARQFGRKGDDKFEGVSVTYSKHDAVPMIDGALASIVCRVVDQPRGGTHTVFFGQAIETRSDSGNPLAYFKGSFGRLERLREQEAYQGIRRMVLERKVAIGEPLVASHLAECLEVRVDDVNNAMVKLSSEALLDRCEGGDFAPCPITEELSANLYDARANIELGVIANHLERIPDAVLDELEEIVEQMGVRREVAGGEPEDFLALHTKYHAILVALSGSAQLQDSYQRLSIAAVWRSVWRELAWQEQLDQTHLEQLNRSLRQRNLRGAVTAVRAYSEQAKAFARIAIQHRGGFL